MVAACNCGVSVFADDLNTYKLYERETANSEVLADLVSVQLECTSGVLFVYKPISKSLKSTRVASLHSNAPAGAPVVRAMQISTSTAPDDLHCEKDSETTLRTLAQLPSAPSTEVYLGIP